MPPKVSAFSSRSSKATRKAVQRPSQYKPTPKRSKNEGTSSSPYIIESDGEGDVLRAPAPCTKRRKLADVLQPLALPDNAERSDNGPFINRIVANTPAQKETIVKSSAHTLTTAVPPALRFLPSEPARPPYDVRKLISKYSSPAHIRPTPSPSSRSSFPLYSKQTNLTPAFQCISDVTQSSLGIAHTSAPPNPFARDFMVHRRLPTSDRLFTNRTLSNVNSLILSMPKVESEETRRSAKAKMRGEPGSATKKGGVRKRLSEKDIEVEEDAEMVEDECIDQVDANTNDYVEEVVNGMGNEGCSGTDVHAGGEIEQDGYESDNTLVGDAEDECSASPAAARKMQMHNESRVGRTARSTPATDVVDLTDVINLTEDEPTVTPAAPPPTPQDEDVTLAERLCRKSRSPPSFSEHPDTTAGRETAFLRAFNTKWWAGGLTPRAALVEVNATLHPLIKRFDKEEGLRCLYALAKRAKLAVRFELVYHLDQDPGVDALPLAKMKKGEEYGKGIGKVPSPMQQSKKDLKDAETKPYRSPFGKISEARYTVFENRFYAAVIVQDSLFKLKKGKGRGEKEREEESLWSVVEQVNE